MRKIAILIYGYFYIDGHMALHRAAHSKKQLNRYSFVQDSFGHFMSHLYLPLKEIYDSVDVYMIVHSFDHPNFDSLKKELIKTCSFFNIYWTNKFESPRLTCSYFNLMRHCINHKIKYDRYIITRNDIFYKHKITSWIPPESQNNDHCYYLFKDHEIYWKTEKKISDIIFIVDGDLQKFQNCVKKYIIKYPQRSDMHDIYLFLEKEYRIRIDCIVEGYYDSNTAKIIKQSCNPIYIMLHRQYYFDANEESVKGGVFFSLNKPKKIIQEIIDESLKGQTVNNSKLKTRYKFKLDENIINNLPNNNDNIIQKKSKINGSQKLLSINEIKKKLKL